MLKRELFGMPPGMLWAMLVSVSGCFSGSAAPSNNNYQVELIPFQTANDIKGSAIPVIINTLTQLYYVYALRDKEPKTYQSKLTNVIAMTIAGVYVFPS